MSCEVGTTILAHGGRMMGAKLIAEALAFFSDVGYDAFRLLMRMAHTALDDDREGRPGRMYFGGRDVLASTLYRDLPACEAKQDSKEWRTAYADVKRALRVLVDAGAIEREGSAHTGNRQVYRLLLKRSPDFAPSRRGGFRSKRGGPLPPQEGSVTASPEGRPTASPVDERGEAVESQEGRLTASPKEQPRSADKPEERFQEPSEEIASEPQVVARGAA